MKKLSCLLAVLSALCLLSSNAIGQLGAYPYVTLDSKGFDSVNPGNTNVRFSIPIVNRTGRGIPFNYAIQYEGLVWTPVMVGGTPTWAYDASWGFHGALNGAVIVGYLTETYTHGSACAAGSLNSSLLYTTYTYHEPSGTAHAFNYTDTTDCNDNDTYSGDGSTSDGSGFSVVNSGTQVRTRNGLIISPASQAGTGQQTAISDANGNTISSDGNGTFTDTLGVVALQVAGGTQPTTFTYPVAKQANGATTATATITYTTYTIQTNFQAYGRWGEVAATPGVRLPSKITLADGSTYQFTYEQTPGYAGNVTGRLASVTLPNGGVIQYAYPGCNNGGGMGPDGSPCLMQRTTSDGVKSYYHYTSSTSPYKTYTVDEANNETDYQFQLGANGNPYEVNHKTYQGAPSSSDLMEYDVYYNSDWGHSQTISTIGQVDVAQAQNGNRLSHTATVLNTAGQATAFTEYDAADNIMRQTHNQYDSHNNLLDSFVGDPFSNALVSHTSYGYDETALQATSGVPQHGAASASRGNLTSVHQWIDGTNHLDTTTAYYDTGVPASSTSPSGTTTYTYDATQAFVKQTTMPTPSSGASLSTKATYDTNSTALLTATGYNAGQTVTVTQYDPLMRPLTVTYPDTGATNYTYTTGYTQVAQGMNSSQGKAAAVVYDGYGRPIRSIVAANANTWYLTDTCYGPTGLPQYVSIPYAASAANPAGNNCTAANKAEKYTYDALGRVTNIAHADGTATSYSYLINGAAYSTKTTDENGKVTIVDTNALGETTIACEVTTTTLTNSAAPGACNTGQGATGYKTSYAYNRAAHTTTVTQGTQTRTFQTDALGRSIYTSEPERGVTTYGYAYSGGNLTVTRTRPTANQTSASAKTTTTTLYDALGRPTDVQYATNSSNPSYSAERQYLYDVTPSDSTFSVTNPLGQMTRAQIVTGNSSNAISRFAYDIMGRANHTYDCSVGWCANVQSGDARAWYRAYAYDLAGDRTTESWNYGWGGANYPSVGLSFAYTNAGELQTVTGGLSDNSQPKNPTHYNALSFKPTGPYTEQYGNGVYGNTIYDAMGRKQGKWQCYQQGPTQDCNGANAVAGTGYVNFISGNRVNRLVNLQGDNTFGYDDLGRLTSQTPTGGAAGLTLTWNYDQYGNRYSQTASGSGSAPQPSFGVNTANNQISGFSYDAAGNVTGDGLHTYRYDAEGNLVCVDNCSTSQDSFDALNRRVAHATGSGSTLHYQRYEYNIDGRLTDVWQDENIYETLSRYTAGGESFAYWTSDGQNPGAGKMHYQHADYLGTVHARSNDVGTNEGTYTSLPFGDGYSSSGTDANSEHYAGLDRDAESDTHHATFRTYSSRVGRWLQPDPYNGSYDASNPQSLNRYNYVLNSPIVATDPDGLNTCDYSSYCPPPSIPISYPPITVVVTTTDPGQVGFTGSQCAAVNCIPTGTGTGSNQGPGNNGGSSGTGGTTTGTNPAPNYGIPVKRNFSRNFACKSNAAQVMGALESNFSGFANTTGGNTFSIFTPGSVSVGQQIDISVGLQAFGHTFAYSDVSVTVQSASSSSLVFQSTPSHVLYPATVSFSASDIGNGQINFTTNVNATTNGLSGTAAFLFGGRTGETNTWNNLLNNVDKFCSHP